MTPAGRREFSRRMAVMWLLVTGLIQLGHDDYFLATALLAGSVAVYIYIPAVPAPVKAMMYDTGSSQAGPDWIGFVLSSLAFAFPVWAAISESHWGAIHPSAVLLWPMGLITSSFWIIGALYASYWIEIKRRKLVISSAFSMHQVPFKEIRRVKTYRRGLPKWLYLLTPLMIMKGQYGGAGSVLLARKRTGIELELKSGKSVSVSDSAYHEEIILILEALERNGVKLTAALHKRLK